MSQSDINTVESHVSSVVTSILYPVGRCLLLPSFFGSITVNGVDKLPQAGPLVIAPTHRSRWDGLAVGHALGRPVTGRDLRFMVSANEMQGLQGWLIRQFGGFPVDTDRAAVAALRHGIELLQQGEALVIFPEGDVMRDRKVQTMKPGLARIALQAQQGLSQGQDSIQVIPVSLGYGQLVPQRGCNLRVTIGAPINVKAYMGAPKRQAARELMDDLKSALNQLIEIQCLPDTEAMVMPSVWSSSSN